MFYVIDPYARRGEQRVSGPFEQFEDARQDASERNIAGDLLIVSDARYSRGDSTTLDVVGDIDGRFTD